MQPETWDNFKFKFRAWWLGAPLSPTSEHSPDIIPADAPEPGDEKNGDSSNLPAAPKISGVVMSNVVQEVWGQGCLGPGGPDYVEGLAKPLNPNSKQTMLMLSAELGGPAQFVAEGLDIYVAAYESAELITAKGIDTSASKTLGRKIDLKIVDFETLKLPGRKFAYALWKEGLFRVADKRRLLRAVYDSLKPGGGFVITDLVLPDKVADPAQVKAWAEEEPIPPTLWSNQQAVAALKSIKFNLYLQKDISDEFQILSNDVWKSWMVKLPTMHEAGQLDEEFRTALMSELQYWIRRSELINSGDLRVYRYFAQKPEDSLASVT